MLLRGNIGTQGAGILELNLDSLNLYFSNIQGISSQKIIITFSQLKIVYS